jgi:hypothetical protein
VVGWAVILVDRPRFEEDGMKYMLLVCVDPSVKRTEEGGDIDEWLTEVKDVRLDGDRLEGPQAAKSVRVRDGETLVTAGPFTETQEWIAGYDILDCDNFEEAIAFAAKHPVARNGIIEVRPFPAD